MDASALGWMTAPTKPRLTLPKRLGYFALMLAGVGMMLLAAAADTADNRRIVRIAGLVFVVAGIGLLVVAGGLDWYRRVFGRKLEAENEADKVQPTPVAETAELTQSERALIQWLRMNDVPPDIVATAIREILERRMGR